MSKRESKPGVFIDMTGKRFGRLTVLRRSHTHRHPNGKTSIMWLCVCDCGQKKAINGNNLRSGITKSCGCYHDEIRRAATKKHGKTHSRLYGVWGSMRQRCNDPNHPAYQYYGGKGVAVCPEWDDFECFEAWAMSSGYNVNAKPHECTIDRIDNDGDYCPDNCRWVNSTVQSNNQQSNVLITFSGKTQTRAQWAKEIGIKYHTLRDRIDRYGWSVERALTEPLRRW